MSSKPINTARYFTQDTYPSGGGLRVPRFFLALFHQLMMNFGGLRVPVVLCFHVNNPDSRIQHTRSCCDWP